MHGLLIGAVFGIGALACMSAVRSWRARARMAADARASRTVLAISAVAQMAIGLVCMGVGVWMLVAWAPV